MSSVVFFRYRYILFYILFFIFILYSTRAPSRYIYTLTISRTVLALVFNSHDRTDTHHTHALIYYALLRALKYMHSTIIIIKHSLY